MKENSTIYYKSCQSCGRPQTYCKGECCGKPRGCQCKEYGPKTCGCIRQKAPECPYEAVIPSVTVESVSNLKDLADCFVHVSDINTTFYIDDKHRIMTTWAGLVSVNDYDFEANPLNLRGQIAYDAKNNKAAIFDKQGANYIFQISDIENDYMLLENKPAINGVTLEGDKSLKELDIAATFDTVADMKSATNLVNGSYARTLGFHTINDGGGATYYITDSGTANEMDVIAIDTLYANLVYSDKFVPEMVGAYGDGSTDDTTYLQHALSIASTTGKTLSLNNKIYLSDALTCGDIIITGNGGIIKVKTFGITALLTVTGKPVIDGIKFDGDEKSDHLVYINGLECNIQNCTFVNSVKEAIKNTANPDEDVIAHIENCTFTDCIGGIHLSGNPYENPEDYLGKVEFINCVVNGDSGSSGSRLYYFTKLDYVYVSGGEFTGNQYAATNIYQVNHGEVIGGYYHDMTRGVTLGQITKNCIVTNTINENLTEGGGLHIDLVTADRIYPVSHSIVCNNIVKNAFRGMYIQGKNISITDNYVYCGSNTTASGGIIRFNAEDDNTADCKIVLDNLYVYNCGDINSIINCSDAVIHLGKIYVDGNNISYSSFASHNLCYKENKSDITTTSYYVKLTDEILFIEASATTNIYLPGAGDSKLSGRRITIIRTDDTETTVRLRCRNDNGYVNGEVSSASGARINQGVNNIIQTGAGEYWTY